MAGGRAGGQAGVVARVRLRLSRCRRSVSRSLLKPARSLPCHACPPHPALGPQDGVGNIVIRRPGSGGGEDAPPVIVQGGSLGRCENAGRVEPLMLL